MSEKGRVVTISMEIVNPEKADSILWDDTKMLKTLGVRVVGLGEGNTIAEQFETEIGPYYTAAEGEDFEAAKESYLKGGLETLDEAKHEARELHYETIYDNSGNEISWEGL